MKRFYLGFGLLIGMGLLGCDQSSSSMEEAASDSSSHHEEDHVHDDGHAHSEGGHDHSEEGHAHGIGPHGGTIADWGGGKYHVEFTVDHDKQSTEVFILGPDEKTPTPIASESVELSINEPQFQLTLTPSPQESDPAGKATRFSGTHEGLGVVREFSGTITAVVDGVPYSGDFSEESHGDHAH